MNQELRSEIHLSGVWVRGLQTGRDASTDAEPVTGWLCEHRTAKATSSTRAASLA